MRDSLFSLDRGHTEANRSRTTSKIFVGVGWAHDKTSRAAWQSTPQQGNEDDNSPACPATRRSSGR